MATKKSAMFTLTERVTLTAVDTATFATIDLGSYVDVGDRQALQVHSVDFIYQGSSGAVAVNAAMGGSGHVVCQVTDLNRGGLVFANDRSLIASADLIQDIDAYLSRNADLYPDNFGKGSDDGRFVVNDQLYITALSTARSSDINITVRVNASIVTLGAKDFMAIAIQSTAADN